MPPFVLISTHQSIAHRQATTLQLRSVIGNSYASNQTVPALSRTSGSAPSHPVAFGDAFTPGAVGGPSAGGPVSFNPQAIMSARILAEETYNEQQRQRVTAGSVRLAQAVGLPPQSQALIQLAGQVYNKGKAPGSNGLWIKTGPLTQDEVRQMQQYPLYSVNHVLALSMQQWAMGNEQQARQLEETIPIVLTHKYNYDGSGYPGQQISGDQIHIEAQILGLMDAYYAMTSQRPYRPAPMTPAQAFQTLLNESGTKWNPNLVAALFGLMP